jgi:eukaryotic-like serine/threonine-protein kinase
MGALATVPGVRHGSNSGLHLRNLHLSLALLPWDPSQIAVLSELLLRADPEELLVIRAALRPYAPAVTERLWALLTNTAAEREHRFRAACALAAYDPGDPRWSSIAEDVVAKLSTENPLLIAGWMNGLRSAQEKLVPARLFCERVAPTTSASPL